MNVLINYDTDRDREFSLIMGSSEQHKSQIAMLVDIVHVVSYVLNSLRSNLPKQHALYGLRNVKKKRLEQLTLTPKETKCKRINVSHGKVT